jgi:hypothetical protein
MIVLRYGTLVVSVFFMQNEQLVDMHTDVRNEEIHYNVHGEKQSQPCALNRALAVYSVQIKHYLTMTMPTSK